MFVWFQRCVYLSSLSSILVTQRVKFKSWSLEENKVIEDFFRVEVLRKPVTRWTMASSHAIIWLRALVSPFRRNILPSHYFQLNSISYTTCRFSSVSFLPLVLFSLSITITNEPHQSSWSFTFISVVQSLLLLFLGTNPKDKVFYQIDCKILIFAIFYMTYFY